MFERVLITRMYVHGAIVLLFCCCFVVIVFYLLFFFVVVFFLLSFGFFLQKIHEDGAMHMIVLVKYI